MRIRGGLVWCRAVFASSAKDPYKSLAALFSEIRPTESVFSFSQRNTALVSLLACLAGL